LNARRWFTVLLLILLLAGSLYADQENGITALKTETGVLLVWNQPDDYFTLEIKGKEIRPLDSSEHVFFTVDGIPFQVQSVAASEVLKDAGKVGQSPQSILTAHKDWEAKYVESSLGRKLNVQSSPLVLKGGGEALFWKFDMPEGLKSDARQQQYLSVVNGRNILFLNGVVTGEKQEAVVRQLLVDTMETLKNSPKPIDLLKLQESIRNGRPR